MVNGLLDAQLASTGKPALVFLNFMDAHDPYFPPPEFYDKGAEPPLDGFDSDVRHRSIPSWMSNPDRIEDEQQRRDFRRRLANVSKREWSLTDDLSTAALARYRERYRAELSYLDSELAKTVSILKKHGFWKNSLIVITSDHGAKESTGGSW